MASLQELVSQRESLDRQIEEMTTRGRVESIEKIRALMAEHGVTLADLGGQSNRSRRGANGAEGKPAKREPGAKVAAKYRNESTGESWSGRGLKPRWLTAAIAAGKKIEDFAL